MYVSLSPSFAGEIVACPSKSHEQRLICGAMLADGKSTLYNYGNSTDVVAARNIAEGFGAKIREYPDKVEITGSLTPNTLLNCGESGLAARLFTPIACKINDSFTITGEKTLLNRPITSGFEIFKLMNCSYKSNEGKLPIEFTHAQLLPGVYEFEDSITSQLLSGLFMALPQLNGSSKLIIKNPISLPYLHLTIKTLEQFGININHYYANNSMIVNIIGNQKYIPIETSVEGDWSSMAFPLVAAAITGKIDIFGLDIKSVQADKEILKVFEAADIKYIVDNKKITALKSEIKSFDFNAKHCPDLIPILIILALNANGTTVISGSDRLKHKESSRAEVMKTELAKIGIDITIGEDMVIIHGKQSPKKSASLNSHGDHRIAMAFTVLGLTSEHIIKIENHNCISKSYSYFYEDMINSGANIYE